VIGALLAGMLGAVVVQQDVKFSAEDQARAEERGRMVAEFVSVKPTHDSEIDSYLAPGAILEINGRKSESPNLSDFYSAISGCDIDVVNPGMLPPMQIDGTLVRDLQSITIKFLCPRKGGGRTSKQFNFVVIAGRVISIDDHRLDG